VCPVGDAWRALVDRVLEQDHREYEEVGQNETRPGRLILDRKCQEGIESSTKLEMQQMR